MRAVGHPGCCRPVPYPGQAPPSRRRGHAGPGRKFLKKSPQDPPFGDDSSPAATPHCPQTVLTGVDDDLDKAHQACLLPDSDGPARVRAGADQWLQPFWRGGGTADSNAGIAWKPVRTGGGLVSPAGATGEALSSVAWGGGRFVAVGRGGTIVHSTMAPPGTAASATATADHLFGVTYGGGRFVAVGANGAIVSSTDGATWTKATSTAAVQLEDVAWNGNRFVVVGRESTILHSDDGTSWTAASQTTDEWVFVVAAGGSRFIGVVWHGPRGVNSIVHSTDGDIWEKGPEIELDGDARWLHDIAWDGTRFVAVGDGGSIMHSADGESWAKRARPLPRTGFLELSGMAVVLSRLGTAAPSCTAPTATAGPRPARYRYHGIACRNSLERHPLCSRREQEHNRIRRRRRRLDPRGHRRVFADSSGRSLGRWPFRRGWGERYRRVQRRWEALDAGKRYGYGRVASWGSLGRRPLRRGRDQGHHHPQR